VRTVSTCPVCVFLAFSEVQGKDAACTLSGESGGERTAQIDDDALRHAKCRICGHLLVTQMMQWEAKGAMCCSTDL